MGGSDMAQGVQVLNRAGIPTFPYPDTAARVFQYMWRYSDNLRALYETPVLHESAEAGLDRASAEFIVQRARKAGRSLLTESESKQLLATYGIPIVKTVEAYSEDEAIRCANEIGFPVVLKLLSQSITHKSDVGGVKLDVRDDAAVRGAFREIHEATITHAGADAFQGVTVQPMVGTDGYELIVGSSVDTQFGPVLLFGSGGRLVEVYRDRSLALPPLNTTLARRMMERTRVFESLHGVRGQKPVNIGGFGRIAREIQSTGRGPALDKGNRHQSTAGLGGANRCPGCASGFVRPRCARSATATHCDPALSGAVRAGRANEEWGACRVPSRSPGGRAPAG